MRLDGAWLHEEREHDVRVLCALGVRGTGRSVSRRIARYFSTMDRIRTADAEKMQQVEGIGAELTPLIDKLAAAGVNMTEPGATPPSATAADDSDGVSESEDSAGGPLAGMTVVVTGAMTGPLEKLKGSWSLRLVGRDRCGDSAVRDV